jgi:hypothetical protein
MARRAPNPTNTPSNRDREFRVYPELFMNLNCLKEKMNRSVIVEKILVSANSLPGDSTCAQARKRSFGPSRNAQFFQKVESS